MLGSLALIAGLLIGTPGPVQYSQPVTGGQAGYTVLAYAEVDPCNATVSGISSPGTGALEKVAGTSYQGRCYQIWIGHFTASGDDTFTYALNGLPNGENVETGFQVYPGNLVATGLTGTKAWGPGTTLWYPKLSVSSGQVYFAYGKSSTAASKGSTPGFSYSQTPQWNEVAYADRVSGVEQPTAVSQQGSGYSIGAIFKNG